jgi:hypothetical protein
LAKESVVVSMAAPSGWMAVEPCRRGFGYIRR